MAFIEVSDIQKKFFEGLAARYNLSVGDFLDRCVRTIRVIFKTWDPKYREEDSNPPEQKEEKPRYTIVFNGQTYEGKNYRDLYVNLIKGIGARILYAAYEGTLTILKPALNKGEEKSNYEIIEDGNKHTFYLYLNLTRESLVKRIDVIAETLKMEWSKEVVEINTKTLPVKPEQE